MPSPRGQGASGYEKPLYNQNTMLYNMGGQTFFSRAKFEDSVVALKLGNSALPKNFRNFFFTFVIIFDAYWEKTQTFCEIFCINLIFAMFLPNDKRSKNRKNNLEDSMLATPALYRNFIFRIVSKFQKYRFFRLFIRSQMILTFFYSMRVSQQFAHHSMRVQ